VKTFADFEIRRKALLDAYDTVLASSILPVEATGAAQVLESKNNLSTNRFIVAVCGRIKAGKSTLINALLFQSPLLPAEDTPHTAKNTLLEHGEKESLQVTFYDSDEWDALIAELTDSNGEIDSNFRAEMEGAGNEGIFKDEWVRSPGLVKDFDGVSKLHEFVTPVGKGGRYTPFVKQVKVIHPHPWLLSVTVADTPGVDDPYKFREDLTKKFVTQAGAVLFVTYAGQAMAQPDVDFLNKYLLHVPSEKRVIAVNKVDTLKGGIGEVKAYLVGLQAHPEPSIRNVFGSSGSVMFVSALGGLTAQLLARGEQLPGDWDSFYRAKLERSGYLEPVNHGIDALRHKVEERLVTQKGKDFLDGHAAFLKALLERKRRLLKSERSMAEGRLEDLGKTKDELRKQMADIDKQMHTLQAIMKRQKTLVRHEVKDHFSTMEAKLRELGRSIMEQTKADMHGEGDINVLPERAAWSFTHNFDKETLNLKDVMDKCIDTIEAVINDLSQKVRASWFQWESSSALDDVLDYSASTTIADMRKTLRKIAAVEALEKVRAQNTSFFQNFFNTEAGRKKAKEAILAVLREQLDECLSNKAEEVAQAMEDELRGHMDRMQKELDKVQELRRKHKKTLASGHADRERESATIQSEMTVLDEGLANVRSLEQYVETALQPKA